MTTEHQAPPSLLKLSAEAREAIALLQQLISTPSFSKEEGATAAILCEHLHQSGIPYERILNNIWARNKYFDPDKPTILLNSHHDTVHPNNGYTKNPFEPLVENGKLFGLGSNDAGASLVSLLACFKHFYPQQNLAYNLLFAASAEEEISGHNGIEILFPLLGKIDFAIVGEPTQMQLAIAEKGLLVLDCTARGQAGHAAREEGVNAIYKALKDINWFTTYEFPEISEYLGKMKMSVTVIHAGKQHNVVPDTCSFTVDLRLTDKYRHEDVLEIIRKNVECEIQPRSLRLKPSSIAADHPIVVAGKKFGLSCYGSPTTSDQALMDVPSLKIGPGDSARSHTADEYICLQEIEEGIALYIQLLEELLYKKECEN